MTWRRQVCATLLVFAWAAIAPAAPSIPDLAHSMEGRLTQIAQAEFGLDAPVARIAALAHVESGWNPNARSPYALGLTQFVPSTAEWIAELRPELSPADPWDPDWSLRAAAHFSHWLYVRIDPRKHTLIPECDRWAFVLSAYNGGLTWVRRDRRLARELGADPDRWWGQVERHSRRAPWAFEENRKYPRRILLVWEHRYVKAGWPGRPACPPQGPDQQGP